MGEGIPHAWQRCSPYAPQVLGIIGGLLFLLQSSSQAHTQSVVMDEGLYMYKGFLFVSGEYAPYQDFGPWTNHMPLSFLIPGVVQQIFGLGLRTGRYFAVFLSGLMLLGLWIVARRFGGRWWAAAAVWAIALNPAQARMYSLAKSQILVACMLVWALVLVLGAERPRWQLLLGSILAGMIFMTRINLAPFLILVVLYIFWQRGWTIGVQATFAAFLPVALLHAIYWPDILKLWASWIPESLSPFLEPWRLHASRSISAAGGPGMPIRLQSFFQGIRFHLVSYVGTIATLVLWPQKEEWENIEKRKITTFLAAAMVLLTALHAWASMGKDYCVFCFRDYNAYYAPAGLLLPAISFNSWRKTPSRARLLLSVLLIVALSAGIGMASFEELSDPLIQAAKPQSNGAVLPWMQEFAQGKLGVTYGIARKAIPIFVGFFLGVVLLLASFLVWHRSANGKALAPGSYAYWLWSGVLLTGLIFSPTVVFGGGYRIYDCEGDVIANYESVGAYLGEKIPGGSLVYWQVYSPTLLLYLPQARIFPAQLNGAFSFVEGGESNELVKFGRWNEELAWEWIEKADFLLFQRRAGIKPLADLPQMIEAERIPKTALTEACREDTHIRIFVNH